MKVETNPKQKSKLERSLLSRKSMNWLHDVRTHCVQFMISIKGCFRSVVGVKQLMNPW